MNKQEAIEEIKKHSTQLYDDFAINRDKAIQIIKQLDEPKQMKGNNKTPQHYQGTIQPIDLINAQDLNFNLGNVVKYVCRAGKKKGENVLSDLDKAKNYINYEIERIKKNE